MKTYNRIMELFWLSIGVIITILVTVMCLKENFSSLAVYYAFAFMALGTYLLRRYMRKRMEKHQAFLNNQKPK
jgi:positive regulator of sigma E activity